MDFDHEDLEVVNRRWEELSPKKKAEVHQASHLSASRGAQRPEHSGRLGGSWDPRVSEARTRNEG